MRPIIPMNSLQAVEARRLGPYSRRMQNMYRYQNRLMANLNASPNWIFLPVMKDCSSGTPQFLHHDKLFLDNNRRCYSLRGPKCKPVQTYVLPKRRRVGGTSECVLSITLPGMVNPNPPPYELLLILTTVDTLEVRNLHTGDHLNTINLALPGDSTFHYRAMQHEEAKNQIVVYSTKSSSHLVLCYMVILNIGSEITKALRVPFPRRVFGRALEKVYLQDGILYMLYRKKKEMRLYDFDEIVRMGQIRNSPDSEPILEITALPKPVLVVPNADQQVEIGGFPCMYVTNLPGSETYSVRTLDHRELGRFEQSDRLRMDSVRFHIDGNGHIAHARQDMIRYYKVEVADRDTSKSDTSSSVSTVLPEDKPAYILRPVRDICFDGQVPTSAPFDCAAPTESGESTSQGRTSSQRSTVRDEREDHEREMRRQMSFVELQEQGQLIQHQNEIGSIEVVAYVLAPYHAAEHYEAPPQNSLGQVPMNRQQPPITPRRARNVGRGLALPDRDNGVPAGTYPLRRSQRIHHLASIFGVPVYYDEDPDEKRLLFGDDYENELNMLLLLGREPGDRNKRGILQMFDDRSGRLVRTMRFNKPLETHVDYTLILDLDVLVVIARAQNAPVSYTHVYRLTNVDSLSEVDCKKVAALGPDHRYSVSFPTAAIDRDHDYDFDFD
ncbi:uncharacterized protein LOC111266761 isoform X1 [Varroa jacobsoni]|uniref:uncharacterized protein LOC111266761 isoform X1 n=2 Tax=Varroa jacobsoni TaxID=62625 RepID=UPI000BF6EADE|nr:uncharacterized protein LOC111266761 isoform X1 [Varroa jacobsoni]XP_022700241.1 uncharacterized protein LOC111266761 isoform X1 [Varroa jacobsoni]XP_022700242.1 uncharacterized protein LOC111266761 isoform X1 [Varroa jacobsoni]